MTVVYEFLLQILNTILLILIPIALYGFFKRHKRNKELINIRISNLEKKGNDLESR